MIQANAIRERLMAVLRRDDSVGVFERWLNSESFDMFQDAEHSAIEMVSAIHLLLGDYYDRRLSEQDFRAGLESLVDNIVVCEPVDLPRECQIVFSFVANASPRPISVPQGLAA